MARLLRTLALAALLCAPACGLAQPVTVRVLNASNRQPLRQQQVTVSLFYGRDNRPANPGDIPDVTTELDLTTDANGEAHFTIPDPAPRYVAVHIFPSERKWVCVCMTDFAPQQILQAGIVEYPADKKHPAPAIAAKPGEVLFLVRSTPFWLRPFYPLYKD